MRNVFAGYAIISMPLIIGALAIIHLQNTSIGEAPENTQIAFWSIFASMGISMLATIVAQFFATKD